MCSKALPTDHYIYWTIALQQASSHCLYSTLTAALPPIAATEVTAIIMKIITHLVALTLSLLLVNADQYCSTLFKHYTEFRKGCSAFRIPMEGCCEITIFPAYRTPSDVYPVTKCANASTCGKHPFTTTVSNAYCNMTTDGGGWTVIQRNRRGSAVSFNRKWADYEEGFGDLRTDFWYGLKAISCLTQSDKWEMRIDFQATNLRWYYLYYTMFSVGSASQEYPLTVGGYSGSVSSSYAVYYNGMKFSTYNNDNDRGSSNCATSTKSGYWFNNCRYVNLNQQPPYIHGFNVLWAEMKIRPKNCLRHQQ